MIIIASPEYREWTGGIIALHCLAEALWKEGKEVAFWPYGPNAFWSPYSIPTVISVKPDDIVVYPESVQGNPLGAKRRVIYYLGRAQLRSGEAIFYSAKWKQVCGGKADDPVLFMIDSKHKTFYDKKGERNGICFTCRKNRHPSYIHGDDAFEIPRGKPNSWLQDTFNRHAQFVSYDFNTFLSTQAAFSGADSIVAPQDGGSQELLDAGYPSGKAFGISYATTKSKEQLFEERLIMKDWFIWYERKQIEMANEIFDVIIRRNGWSGI